MIRPMLARAYAGILSEGGWFVEPKLDGLRAVWDGDDLYSRNGKKLYNPVDVILYLRQEFPNVSLDGELFAKDWGSTHSAVRKHEGSKGEVDYFVFDVTVIDKEEQVDKTWHERRALLSDLLRNCGDSPIRTLTSIPLAGRNVKVVAKQYVSKGFEGIILKRSEAVYQPGKRSKDWLKVKFVNEVDAKIVGVEEGKGKLKGMLGALAVRTEEGEEFKVGTGMSNSERKFLWSKHEGLIGLTVTLRYQMDKKIVGRFPSYVRLREEL